MKQLTLAQIIKKLNKIKFPSFDLIVAIGKDGIMPASILRHHLNLPVQIIWLNYRNKNNKPILKKPILKKPILKKPLNQNLKKLKNKKILLVDTLAKTGKTLNKAKQLLKLSNESEKGLGKSKTLLKNNKIKTFVINGKADYSLFNYKECIEWPW